MGVSGTIAAVSALSSLGLGIYGATQKQEGLNQQTAGAQQQAIISGQEAQLSAQYSGQQQQLNIQSAQNSVDAANQSAAINTNIIGFNQQAEDQRRQAMELDANRQKLQIVRNMQQSRAQALTAASAQGARLGSGLQGGYAQISGQSNVNYLGVNQNLNIGEALFGLNSKVSQQNQSMVALQDLMAQKQASLTTQNSQLTMNYAQQNADLQTQYAAAGGQIATGAGQSAFGGALMSGASSLYTIGTNFGKLAQGFNFQSYGTPTTTQSYNPNQTGGLY